MESSGGLSKKKALLALVTLDGSESSVQACNVANDGDTFGIADR